MNMGLELAEEPRVGILVPVASRSGVLDWKSRGFLAGARAEKKANMVMPQMRGD
jgi:hypothetical protein